MNRQEAIEYVLTNKTAVWATWGEAIGKGSKICITVLEYYSDWEADDEWRIFGWYSASIYKYGFKPWAEPEESEDDNFDGEHPDESICPLDGFAPVIGKFDLSWLDFFAPISIDLLKGRTQQEAFRDFDNAGRAN